MKIFTIEDPIFKTEPVFIIGCSYDELNRYLSRFKVNAGNCEHIAGRMLTFEKPPWRVVWSRKPDLPVILHETFHLVTRICADKGITIRAHNEHGENDDETAAYLLEFFARRILKRIRR